MCPRHTVSSVPLRRWTHWRFTGHYVENTGNTTLKFLEIFNTGKYPSYYSRTICVLTLPFQTYIKMSAWDRWKFVNSESGVDGFLTRFVTSSVACFYATRSRAGQPWSLWRDDGNTQQDKTGCRWARTQHLTQRDKYKENFIVRLCSSLWQLLVKALYLNYGLAWM